MTDPIQQPVAVLYRDYFGFTENPFALAPNTRLFAELRQYEDAILALTHGIECGEGFIKVIAEVGMGKSLLCRLLLNRLASNSAVAYIPNPSQSPYDLLKSVAIELGLRRNQLSGEHEILKALQAKLFRLAAEGKRVVLLIDEAQAMPTASLEAVRLLANLETESRKLVQVVLFGHPELDDVLMQHDFRQLRQRIGCSIRLAPLNFAEFEGYVVTRLQKSGLKGPLPFPHHVMRRLYFASAGVPRLINVLCHKTLMAMMGRGLPQAELAQANLAIRDSLELVLGGGILRQLRLNFYARLPTRRLGHHRPAAGLA